MTMTMTMTMTMLTLSKSRNNDMGVSSHECNSHTIEWNTLADVLSNAWLDFVYSFGE